MNKTGRKMGRSSSTTKMTHRVRRSSLTGKVALSSVAPVLKVGDDKLQPLRHRPRSSESSEFSGRLGFSDRSSELLTTLKHTLKDSRNLDGDARKGKVPPLGNIVQKLDYINNLARAKDILDQHYQVNEEKRQLELMRADVKRGEVMLKEQADNIKSHAMLLSEPLRQKTYFLEATQQELMGQIEQLKSQNGRLRQLAALSFDATKHTKSIQNELNVTINSNRKYAKTVETLHEDIEKKRHDINELQSSIENQEIESKKLEKQLSISEFAVKSRDGMIEKQKKELNSLRVSLRETEETRNKLASLNDTLSSSHAIMMEEHKEMTARTTHDTEVILQLNRKFAKASKEVNQLSNKVDTVMETSLRWKAKYVEIDGQFRDAVDSNEKTLKSAMDKNEMLRAKVVDYEKMVNQQHATIESLREELKSTQDTLSATQASLDARNTENKEQQERITTLEADLLTWTSGERTAIYEETIAKEKERRRLLQQQLSDEKIARRADRETARDKFKKLNEKLATAKQATKDEHAKFEAMQERFYKLDEEHVQTVHDLDTTTEALSVKTEQNLQVLTLFSMVRKALRQARARHEECDDKIAFQQNEISKGHVELREKSDEIMRLDAVELQLKAKLKSSQERNGTLNEEKAELVYELKKARDAEAMVRALREKDMKERESANDRLHQTASNVDDASSHDTVDKTELSAEIRKLHDQLYDAQQASNLHEKRVERLQQQLRDMGPLKEQASAMKQQMKAAFDSQRRTQEELDLCKRKIETLDKALITTQNKMAEKTSQHHLSMERNNKINEQFRTFKNQHVDCTLEMTRQANQIDAFKAHNTEMENEVRRLKHLQKMYDAVTAKSEEQAQSMEALQAELARLSLVRKRRLAIQEEAKRRLESLDVFLGILFEESKRGILVTEVTDNSPAEVCGLIEGDNILEVNGVIVKTKQKFFRALTSVPVGTSVPLMVLRHEAFHTFLLVTGSKIATIPQIRALRKVAERHDDDFAIATELGFSATREHWVPPASRRASIASGVESSEHEAASNVQESVTATSPNAEELGFIMVPDDDQ